MAGGYYGNELIATERVLDRYQYAEAHRLANGVSKDNRTRHHEYKRTRSQPGVWALPPPGRPKRQPVQA